jgi:FkbM family methyltransferase
MFYKLLNAYTRQYSFPYRGLKYFLKMANWFGVADKTYKKRLPEDFYMLLTPSEHIQQQLFWYGYYEKDLGDMIKKCLKPGDVFLDIGANIGYFSLLAANSEPTSKVISFEPAKDLFQKLEENISINTFKNITTLNVAVGEINEETELFISGSDNLGMSSFRQPGNYSGKKEKVKVVTIDSWFKTAGLSKVDLIKLDIEGSELAALKGMQETLQNFKPLVIAEVNPETLASFNLTPGDIYSYLNKLNFDGFIISEKEGLKRVNQNNTRETKNVLFIHPDKIKFYQELFNK